jgi:4-nitrophenyl phosphatase
MSNTEPKKLSSTEEYSDLIAKYDTFLFDCDGVLWSGDEIIPGAVKVLEKLRSKGKQVIFVTNNASKSRKAIKVKFDKLNIEAKEVRAMCISECVLPTALQRYLHLFSAFVLG